MTRYAPQWLQQQSYSAAQDRRLIQALWPAPASTGGAATISVGTMTIQFAAGQCAVPSPNSSGSTLCTWDATEFVTIAAAPPSGQNRIDIVTVHPRGNDLDGGANNDFIFDTIVGTAAASPVAPAVPAGQVPWYQVNVPGGAASLVAGNLTDVRPGGLAITTYVPPASSPRGYQGDVVGPASQLNLGATQVTIVSLAVPMVAGRRYRANATLYGIQQTATGACVAQFVRPDNNLVNQLFNQSLAAGAWGVGSTTMTYSPTTTGTGTWVMRGSTSGGSFAIGAGQGTIVVEDIGGT